MSWPQVEKDFATAVTALDTKVGVVMKAVKDAGIDDRTVVFFRFVCGRKSPWTPSVHYHYFLCSSDNGAHQEGGHLYQFFNSSGYLNGNKRSIHDGGHRAALLVRWPGVVAAGTVSTQQWCFYDFFQTAADIAAVAPADVPAHLDGYSLVPTLRYGDGAQAQPGFIYHEFSGCSDPVFEKYPNLAHGAGQNIRYGNWSGVCVGQGFPCTGKSPGRFFLYNMSTDQPQLRDVALANPDVVSKILTIMAQQYNKHWPAQPTPRPPTTPTPVPPPAPVPVLMKPPCARSSYTGKYSHWWGHMPNGAQEHVYVMDLEADNRVQLNVTDKCCKWSSANGSFTAAASGGGGTLEVVATGRSFTLKNTGTLSEDGCTIKWSANWAPWSKIQEQPLSSAVPGALEKAGNAGK
jgi:hypothetical protein